MDSLNLVDSAEFVGITRSAFYYYIYRGEIKPRRTKSGKRKTYNIEDLKRLKKRIERNAHG